MDNPQAATATPVQKQGGKANETDKTISLVPKFLCGLKGDVKMNLFHLDD